jgi:hypothetical protein
MELFTPVVSRARSDSRPCACTARPSRTVRPSSPQAVPRDGRPGVTGQLHRDRGGHHRRGPSTCSTTFSPDATTRHRISIGARTRLPKGHWVGERAPRDLARKGRAFATLDSWIGRQGSPTVQPGAALALAATIQAWSDFAGTSVHQITPAAFSAE